MLQLQLKPARSFLIFMVLMLSGAFVSIFCSFLPYYIQLPLAMVTLIYGGRLIKGLVLLKEQNTIVTVTCRDEGSWLLKERSGVEYPVFLGSDSIGWPWLCFLRFKKRGGKKVSVIVFYDSVDSMSYRRLQVKLGTSYALI